MTRLWTTFILFAFCMVIGCASNEEKCKEGDMDACSEMLQDAADEVSEGLDGLLKEVKE